MILFAQHYARSACEDEGQSDEGRKNFRRTRTWRDHLRLQGMLRSEAFIAALVVAGYARHQLLLLSL